MALNRDVIFMATADEEAGGFFGVGWLVKNRPELFKGVGYVINEGDVKAGFREGGRSSASKSRKKFRTGCTSPHAESRATGPRLVRPRP